jgi:tyrosine-protein kinase Etk/Wzc
MNQNNFSHSNNFKDKYMPYIKRWYLYLITLLVSLAGVWLYANSVTPQYKITGTLLIPDDKKGDGILKATAFSDLNMFQETKTVDNEMEILRSKDLIYSALKNLDLGTSYYYKVNGFKTEELYGNDLPIIVSIIKLDENAYKKTLQIEALNFTTFKITDGQQSWLYRYGQQINHHDYTIKVTQGPAFLKGPETLNIGFNDLYGMATEYSAGRLVINPVIKESNAIMLALTDPVPARGVDILTNLINLYNQETVKKKNTTAVNTILFIDKRLAAMEHDLSSIEGDIETYKLNNDAENAGTGAQINLTKSADYNQMLEASKVQLGIVNTIEAYLNDATNQYRVVPSTMGLTDAVLTTLISKYNDLLIERNKMMHTASAQNPLLQNLTDQIANLRVNIQQNLGIIKGGLIIQNKNLRQNLAQYDSRVRSVPKLERGLLQRSREQTVKSGLYQYLLQKREETALSLSATIPAAQVIDKPACDPTPEFPKKPLLYLYTCMFALLMPSLYIFTRQQFNFKVRDTSDVKEIPGLRILGQLSHTNVKSQVAVRDGSRTEISELFRYIRFNLGLLGQEVTPKTILVTSCIQGEGKTFFSINLGLTLAQSNKKVLILEFDLRKPDLLKKLGMKQEIGITDYLENESILLGDCIQAYEKVDNLYIMGCGKLPQNPSELLMTPRVDMLFSYLKDHFDYLIVDTSPVGSVADALSLANNVDSSIYLVRYNYTNIEQLDILRDIYENEKLKNLMVVFNDAKKENRNAYAYGSYLYAPASAD